MKVTVDSGWLRKHIDDRNLAILDARSGESYNKSHIPGAVHADLFHYFVPGTDKKGLQEFQKDLAIGLGKMGLTGKERVVVYESKLGMRAARVAWMLEYAGLPRVYLLEGGFDAWRRGGQRLEKKPSKSKIRTFAIHPNPQLLATAEQISEPNHRILLDVRSEGEYTGKETRECDRRKGRIPHARWLEWSSFLDSGKRFQTKSRMAKILKEKGLDRGAEIVTYCHRGARAAAAFYALRGLGYRNVRNYIGSWHEWSDRDCLPVERGAVSHGSKKSL